MVMAFLPYGYIMKSFVLILALFGLICYLPVMKANAICEENYNFSDQSFPSISIIDGSHIINKNNTEFFLQIGDKLGMSSFSLMLNGTADIEFDWKSDLTNGLGGELRFIYPGSFEICRSKEWSHSAGHLPDGGKVTWRVANPNGGYGYIDNIHIRYQNRICERCFAAAPDMDTFAGFQLNRDFLIENGANCSEGCSPIIDVSSVDFNNPGNYSYKVGCNGDNPIQKTGRIRVVPLEIESPYCVCRSEPRLSAYAANISGAEYSWSIMDGYILGSNDAHRIEWVSGNNMTKLNLSVSLSGNEKYVVKDISINSNCIYLSNCENITSFVKNNTKLCLLNDNCPLGRDEQDEVIIESIHNLTICSAYPGERSLLNDEIKIGNSSEITLDGLMIQNCQSNATIMTDNLRNSNIVNNIIRSNCAIFMNDSFFNNISNNQIEAANNHNAINLRYGKDNNISLSLDEGDLIREKISHDNAREDITCLIHQNCYACKRSGTDEPINLLDNSDNIWGDLYGKDICS